MARMTLAEARQLRDVNLDRARRWAALAGDTTLRWGIRYEAAVTGDECLDLARDFDSYVKQLEKS